MEIRRRQGRIRAVTWMLLAPGLLLSLLWSGAAWPLASSLSRWISHETLPQIEELLASHPRVAGEGVRLAATTGNGLESAIAEVLLGNLGADAGITLQPAYLTAPESTVSIDDLECLSMDPDHAQLRITARGDSSGSGQVEITLTDADSVGTPWRRWQWRGVLTGDERAALASPVTPAFEQGSLRSPWSQDAIGHAAAALSHQLACDLREQIVSDVSLEWSAAPTSSRQLDDVFNASQHLLGGIREIKLAADADIDVAMKAEPFQDDILQVWLTGVPQRQGFEPVQAVTYIRRAPQSTAGIPVEATVPPVPPVPGPRGVPLKFIDVNLIDVSQAERSLSGANLRIRLQLGNRARWPIHYAFYVSGGYYLNCIGKQDFYRHEKYGYIEGEIPAGSTLQRELSINGVQHKPNPWFGPRKCAGFKQLEGFEDFAKYGYKVTDSIRWSM